MSSQLDNLNILVVTDSTKDLISFLKVDYKNLVETINLSSLSKKEYLSFTFFNILKQSIINQAQVYLKFDLVLIVSTSIEKIQSADICNFINIPFIHIRIF